MSHNEWQHQTLSEILDITKGNSYRSVDLGPSTTALVTLKSFERGGGYRHDGLKAFTGKHKTEQIVHPGEIVIALTDVTQAAELIGRPARVPVPVGFATLVASIDAGIVRPKSGKVDPRFLYYLLLSPELNAWTYAHTTGTTVLHLNPHAILAFQAAIPPLHEQREIARILGALDDKIELNRRMNTTLEAMARALFQSWFVDFDPVRAKAEGRQPVGMDAETAALFPDSFEDSALGPIPKGWALTSANEIFSTRNTRVEPDEHKNHLRYVALDDMRSKSIGIDSFRAGSEVNSSIIEFIKGDVLFGAMRPYFHKVGLAPFSGITRTTTFVLVPKDEWLRYYGLFALSTDVAIEYATSASIGTTIPYVTWDALGKYRCTLAPPEILKAFSNSVGDLLARMTLNIASAAALAGARDTLLPKLLSGELQVGDVAA